MKKCGNRSKSFPPPLINLDEFLASKRGEMCNHLIHSTKEASESRFNLVLWNRTKEKGEGESTAKKLCFCPIIGLSIEEFFVLSSLLRLNCPRALQLIGKEADAECVVAQFLKRWNSLSHHDNRPFHFRRISIQVSSV